MSYFPYPPFHKKKNCFTREHEVHLSMLIIAEMLGSFILNFKMDNMLLLSIYL